MNFNENINELSIFRIRYENELVEIKEIKIPYEQERNVTLHACPDEKGGIYVYVLMNLTENHQSQVQISVHQIKEDQAITLTVPNTLLKDFISQFDELFVNKILKLRSNFFETFNPEHLRSKNFDPYQIVYAKNTIQFIFDLKMGGGKLVSFSQQEVSESKAIGLQLFPKAFSIQFYSQQLGCLILEKDCRSQVIYNIELKDLQDEEFERMKKKYKFNDFSPDDRKFLKVMPIPDFEVTEASRTEFCFVFRKTSVSILHMKTQFLFKIIVQQVHHSFDRICDFFITGKIPNLTLHYFELVHNSNGKFKFRSYNVFYMFEDFWKSLKAYNGNPPINKKSLIIEQNITRMRSQQTLISDSENETYLQPPETSSRIEEEFYVNQLEIQNPQTQQANISNSSKTAEKFAILELKLQKLEERLTATQAQEKNNSELKMTLKKIAILESKLQQFEDQLTQTQKKQTNITEQRKTAEKIALMESTLQYFEKQLIETQSKLEYQIKSQEQTILERVKDILKQQNVQQDRYCEDQAQLQQVSSRTKEVSSVRHSVASSRISSHDSLKKSVNLKQKPFVVSQVHSPRLLSRQPTGTVEKKNIDVSQNSDRNIKQLELKNFDRRIQQLELQMAIETDPQKTIEITQLPVDELQKQVKILLHNSLTSDLTLKFKKMLFECTEQIYRDFISKEESIKQMESLKQQFNLLVQNQEIKIDDHVNKMIQKQALKTNDLDMRLQEYHKLANIKRRDTISTAMSREWHAELTQDMLTDPDKLKEYVQEEVFLCFKRQFQEISQQVEHIKHINPKTEQPKQISEIGVKLMHLEVRQRQMVAQIREQAQTLNPNMISLQTTSLQARLKSPSSKVPLLQQIHENRHKSTMNRPYSRERNQLFPSLSLPKVEFQYKD